MLTFERLWSSFPEKSEIRGKCFNKQQNSSQPFSDYCAILLSECLIRSGVSTAGSSSTKCWSHAGMKHILLAEQMADWLFKTNIKGLGKRESVLPAEFQEKLQGRTGIIFFKDYWTRGNESFANRSGDHIDLWNKDKITSSSMFTRSILEFFGRVSDLNQAKEIWFWEVK